MYFYLKRCIITATNGFSSPFIEERLYLSDRIFLDILNFAGSRPLLSRSGCIYSNFKEAFLRFLVLVPFYRGAVVFNSDISELINFYEGSRPLLSRSGCI